jgi:UDP-glucose 4-epimerase
MTPKGSYPLAIALFLEQRKNGKPITITGDGKQTRDFTHVQDVVRANLLAATSKKVGKGEFVNIGAGRNVSMNKIAELIGGPKTYIPARLEPKNTLAYVGKVRELLGWSPKVSIEEGIAELKKLWGLA